MFSLTLLCVGRLKEKFYLDAAAEYQKRLRAYADFTLLELPEEYPIYKEKCTNQLENRYTSL